ncbi:hypothetical protein LINPERHAP1_LOCUS29285 [Linum perenne]
MLLLHQYDVPMGALLDRLYYFILKLPELRRFRELVPLRLLGRDPVRGAVPELYLVCNSPSFSEMVGLVL